jgi:hypothetical protein
MDLTRQLILGLSDLARFEQIFDPCVGDAAMFASHRDFGVTAEYAYRTNMGVSIEDTWPRMPFKVRNHIARRHASSVSLSTMSPHAFANFTSHAWPVLNMHGADRMRRLVSAVSALRVGDIVGAVDDHGVLVAALLIVWDGDAVRTLISARDVQHAGGGALSLLLYHAISIAADYAVAFDFDDARTTNIPDRIRGDLVQPLVAWRTEPGYLPSIGPAIRMVRG